MKHIELFAGCGGLCLGLEKAGFRLKFANELSPMASETFAFNLLNESLLEHPLPDSRKTVWLSSNFSTEEMGRRLREDPRTFPVDEKNCELAEDGHNLDNGNLVVGNILSLNNWLKSRPEVTQRLQQENLDLVSGGPPCQSFSLAGLREKNNEKNSLPWAFANFVDMVKPKITLLENVTGILRPFTENGQKYYAWFEVAKAFAKINYVPLALHINAKFAGVAQNRPRFILISVREDFFKTLELNATEKKIFAPCYAFWNKVQTEQAVSIDDLPVLDLNTEGSPAFDLFAASFLSPLCTTRNSFTTVQEAIGDLAENGGAPSAYVKKINSIAKGILPHREMNGCAHNAVSERVKRRFRLYQVLTQLTKNENKDIWAVLSGKALATQDDTWRAISSFSFLQENGKTRRFKNKDEFDCFLLNHQTKKQIQRALVPSAPAPAALSIPDDACHYDELRTLTVREMARIQSFPDSFIFKSKSTTGGLNRRFEVPIYTQIGNAVPVLLGYALGECIRTLLSRQSHQE